MATNSLIHWGGGKQRQLKDLLPLIPHTHTYVEPFSGGAAVLLNKSRSPVEVYNDLDHALVNLFEVVRDDDTFIAFASMLEWVPYGRESYTRACAEYDDATKHRVTRAVLFYTMLNQSIGGKRLAKPSDWSKSRYSNNAEAWAVKQEKLGVIHERLRGVYIECRDALDVLQEWDSPETVFYCDPPYILDTRNNTKYYAVEQDDAFHVELVDVLLNVQGMVILSGYAHPIYQRLRDEGWMTDKYAVSAGMNANVDSNQADNRRVEVVYRNQRACEMGERRPLFIL